MHTSAAAGRTTEEGHRGPRPDPRLALAPAAGGGAAPVDQALARAEGVHHADVAKLLRLTLLDPEIVEAVRDGRLPNGVRLLADLMRPLPSGWDKQRRVLLGHGGR